MQGMRGPGLPSYWGLPGSHRPLVPRAPHRLHLEFHQIVHKPEAREIAEVPQVPRGNLGNPDRLIIFTSKVKGFLQGEWVGGTLC